eukprot:12173001-Karenia_brevis.AAC.1
MQTVASQSPNIKKCTIVPLTAKPTLAHIDTIRDWICKIVPAWTAFKIAPVAEYLGILFGVGAQAEQWKGPQKKFDSVVHSIASAGKPASQSIIAYNSKAASLFSYKSQVFQMDKCIKRKEMAALAR